MPFTITIARLFGLTLFEHHYCASYWLAVPAGVEPSTSLDRWIQKTRPGYALQ